MQEFYAHGKLLLTAEYTVLKGAKALAFPTAFGQKLLVKQTTSKNWKWRSFTDTGKEWFSCSFSSVFEIIQTSDTPKAEFLQKLLTSARDLSPNFQFKEGLELNTHLEFPNNWGLGSSSTLISLIAQFFNIDALTLFFSSAKGSGYDVACAEAKNPIFYQLKEFGNPKITKAILPPTLQKAHFVHLNQKQKSLPEVKRFMATETDTSLIRKVSKLTDDIAKSSSKKQLIDLLKQHERLTGRTIGLESIQSKLFKDYNGVVKSLGAWGGDFVLALGENTVNYFKAKGYPTIITFQEIILPEY